MINKISIAGSLLLIGLTLLSGFSVYKVMRSQIESTLGKGLEVALQGKERLFESQVEEGLADTYAVTTHPFLIKALQEINAQPDSADAIRIMKRDVDSLLLANFTAAFITDIRGNKIMRAGKFTKSTDDKLPLHYHDNSFLVWENDQLILHDTQDILDQDKLRIGTLTTERNLRQLTSSLREISKIGESGEFLMCELLKPGELEMACLISNIDGTKFARLLREINGVPLPISYALDGNSGIITANDYRQVLAVASYTPMSISGIGMMLKLDEKELYGQVTEQIKTIFFYITALVIAGILLQYWLILPLVRKVTLSEHRMRKRLKESLCLNAVRRDMELNLQADEFYQKVIVHLIEAMQFPEITSAMIKFGDKQIVSDRYNKDFMRQLKTQITVKGEDYGYLQVVYSEDQPFLLPEEQDLIDTIASDIARRIEREQAEQSILKMATHDLLTDLPNRYLLRDRITQALAHGRRSQKQAAVLFVDLDYFKTINDTLGHAMGDLLLMEVAKRLCAAAIRNEDTVARQGGDEFVILLPNITGKQEAEVVAKKILNELTRSFDIDGKELHIGGSIGIALFPSDGDGMEEMLRKSDIAMYYAKKNGRNNYQFFSPETNQKIDE